MGQKATRLLVDRGALIVGAVARSPEKVGRDLGELVGLDHDLGVVVDNDMDRTLAETGADVAILSLTSYMAEHAKAIEVCLKHGVNVVSLAEEAFFPWWTSPGVTAKLDRMAREKGVSILGTGHQDVFWLGLGAQLLGAAQRVDELKWSTLWNPAGAGPELLDVLGIGKTPDPSVTGEEREPGPTPSYAVMGLDAMADHLGLGPGRRTVRTELILADEPIESDALDQTIASGSVIGVSEVVRRAIPGEPVLNFTMTGRILNEGERPGEQWEVVGHPPLTLSSSYGVGDHSQVVAQAVHRIPDVIQADPGWRRHDELPPIRYRASLV